MESRHIQYTFYFRIWWLYIKLFSTEKAISCLWAILCIIFDTEGRIEIGWWLSKSDYIIIMIMICKFLYRNSLLYVLIYKWEWFRPFSMLYVQAVSPSFHQQFFYSSSAQCMLHFIIDIDLILQTFIQSRITEMNLNPCSVFHISNCKEN